MSGRDYLGIPREKIAWAPRINPDTCTGCGECRDVCPNGVFELDEARQKMKVVQPDQCVVLCDKCAAFCPTDSIRFPDKTETKKRVGQLLKDMSAKPPISKENPHE